MRWENAMRLRQVVRLGVGLFAWGAAVLSTEAAGEGSSYRYIAYTGQSIPGGTALYSTFDVPRIGQNGAVAFIASLDSQLSGVFAGQPGSLDLVALQDGSAGRGFVTFASFSNIAVNSAGETAFQTVLSADGSVDALWSGNSGLGIEAGDGLGNFANTVVTSLAPPSLNAGNRLAAKLSLSLGVTFGQSTTSALAVGAAGAMSAVLKAGDPAPGIANGTIVRLYDSDVPDNDRPDQNDSGTIAFYATVTQDGGQTSFGVLYEGPVGNFKPVAIEGQAAPGIADALYSFIHEDPSVSSDGKIAFVADLSSDSETVTVPSQAVFSGPAGELAPILRTGDTVPTTTNVVFSDITRACVNETGDVVFQAGMMYPNQTVRPSIWIQRRTGDAVLVAASGVPFDTPSGSQEAIDVNFAGPGAFNDLHEVAFEANFNKGAGIYLADTRPGAPLITVSTPRRPRDFVTMRRSISVRGLAFDDTGVAKVEYTVRSSSAQHRGKGRVSHAITQHAQGDAAWSFQVPLAMGRNEVAVTATDKLGNVSRPYRLVILRYQCSADHNR
jgi:hypothetical protein